MSAGSRLMHYSGRSAREPPLLSLPYASLTSNLTTTGLSNAVKNVQTTSAGFDSTTANTYLGLSVNGGASAAWTVQIVEARLENF